MKFDITIKDLTSEQLSKLLDSFKGEKTVVVDVETYPNTMTMMDIEDEGTPAADVTVDAEGMKWDERIHSSNKTLTKKGVWKARKNVTVEEIERVKAEQMSAPVNVNHFDVPYFAPPVQQAPVQQAPVQQAPVQQDFNSLMKRVAAGFANGMLVPQNIGEIVQMINTQYGTSVNTLADISGTPEIVAFVHNVLQSRGL